MAAESVVTPALPKPTQSVTPNNPAPAQHRFQAHQRLLKRPEYDAVFTNPLVRSSDRYFTLLAIANQKTHPRLGLVVMKKRLKHAVQRNRIKRLARESFRLHAHKLPEIDIVLLVRDGIAEIDNPRLLSALKRHWQRLAKHYAKQAKTRSTTPPSS